MSWNRIYHHLNKKDFKLKLQTYRISSRLKDYSWRLCTWWAREELRGRPGIPYHHRHCDEKANSSDSGIGCDFDEFDSDCYHPDNKTCSHVENENIEEEHKRSSRPQASGLRIGVRTGKGVTAFEYIPSNASWHQSIFAFQASMCRKRH